MTNLSIKEKMRTFAHQNYNNVMKSIKELYRIGTGPSSSHTMGPRYAAQQFAARNPGASSYRVTALRQSCGYGKGHMTDRAIIDTLSPLPG